MLKPNFLLTKKIPITIIRRAAGSYIAGDWVEGTTTNLVIQANIQPMRYHEILMLPEAERSKQWFTVYTDVLLRAQKEGVGGYDSDEFDFKGHRYKVMKVEDYTATMGILEHSKSQCVRKELTPN
jgi:hypothetical protein